MTDRHAFALAAAFACIAVHPGAALAQPAEISAIEDMGTTSTWEAPPPVELVTNRFIAAFGEDCDWALSGNLEMREPEILQFTYRYSFDEKDDPDRPMTIYRFFCNQGAYNQQHAYFRWTDDGLRPLSFAVPVTEATFTVPGDNDSDVADLKLLGFSTQMTLTNSEIDAKTGTITSHSYWRGIGDASSVGVWTLIEGEYVLQTYDVDHSYNGKVDPIRVLDYSGAK
jgi:hypothetical protein